MGLKSKATAVLLALMFGPFGMCYTSFAACIVLFVGHWFLLANGLALGTFVLWIAGAVCNGYMAVEHNNQVRKLFASGKVPG